MKNLKEFKPLIKMLDKEKKKLIIASILILLSAIAGIFTGYLNGYETLLFYPTIEIIKVDVLSIALYSSFILITILPVLLEVMEVYKWKYSEWRD